jgi:Tol biopolymer transport system component
VAWVVVLTALIGALLAVGAWLALPQRPIGNGPIAFETGGDIWVVESDGSTRPTNLTRTIDISERWPVWSPDGRRLAFTASSATESTIHVLDADGRRHRTLSAPRGVLISEDDPIIGWSPDGRSLAVQARGSIREGGLTRVGVPQVVVFDVESERGAVRPRDLEATGFGWSPDGRLGLIGADGRLYAVLSEDDRPVPLISQDPSSPATELLRSPVWLPTFAGRDRVAFTAGLSAVTADGIASGRRDGDILVATADEGVERLIAGSTNDIAPHLSPDGQLLAFGRSSAATADGAFSGPWAPTSETERADLYLVGFDGGREALPEPATIASDVWPDAAWSPDGRQLVTKSSDWTQLVLITLADRDGARRLSVAAPDSVIGGFGWRPLPP